MLIDGKEVSVKDACGTLWYSDFVNSPGIYFLQSVSFDMDQTGKDLYSLIKLVDARIVYTDPKTEDDFEKHFLEIQGGRHNFEPRFTYLGRISELDIQSYIEEKKHEGII